MDVKCTFSNKNAGLHNLTYWCYITKVEQSHKKDHNAPRVSGNHLPGKNNHDVDYILIMPLQLHIFPQNLGETFSQVKKILIFNCGFESITREDLAEFKKLVSIDASYNKFKSIPSDLFIDKPNLKSIDFSNNEIEFVSSKLLEPLMENDLLLVNFRGNKNIDYCFMRNDPKTSLQQLMDIMDTKCVRAVDEESANKEVLENEHAKKLAMLWTTGRYSDFTIISADGSTEFRVHKFVLGLQSSVFDAIFEIKTEDQLLGKLTIQNFSSGTVGEFLRFFYTGNIENETYAMELFYLAEFYKVEKLKSIMEKVVLENVNDSNAFEILSLGHLHSSNTLKDKAFEVIKKMLKGKQLNDDLKEQPEILKTLLEELKAVETLKRKFTEADEKFNSLLKKYIKKNA